MFHIARNGREYGPYTEEVVRIYLADGSLLPSDSARAEGTGVWRPLAEFFPAPTVKPQPPFTPVAPPSATLTPVSRLPQRRRSAVLPMALVGLVAVAAAAWYLFLRPYPTVLFLEGSTTVGDALAPALLREYLRSEGATDITDVKPSDPSSPHHDIRAKLPGEWRTATYSIVANGSGNAFKALASGRAEIGMASRPVNNEEEAGLITRADLRSPASESILALDGLAIVVNPANSVNTLTRQQIAAIFSGKISDWTQVGGSPGPIHLLGRATNSGTFDTFAALIFAGNKNAAAASIRTLENGEDIARAVAADPAAIGYVGLAQISSTKALEISDGSGTTALLPSPFTVATEDYILSRRLFLYSLPSRSDAASRFIAYALGPEGQKIVEQVGFVKQTPTLVTVDVPASAPTAYRREVSGLRRMSLNFRFKTDSVQLDNKALADLPRALTTLTREGTNSGVTVLGFADSRGSAGQNQRLSEQRAQVVGDRLRAYGLQIQTFGLSSAMPVGNNESSEGRDKNRRVELWTH